MQNKINSLIFSQNFNNKQQMTLKKFISFLIYKLRNNKKYYNGCQMTIRLISSCISNSNNNLKALIFLYPWYINDHRAVNWLIEKNNNIFKFNNNNKGNSFNLKFKLKEIIIIITELIKIISWVYIIIFYLILFSFI